MKYLLLPLLLLAGCGMPETARSTKQAEQAVEGTIVVLETAAPIIDNIKDATQKKQLQDAMMRIAKLLQSARISLQPALTYLGEGKEVKVDTTVNEAVKSTDSFITKANMQAGKAAVEVESRLSWESILIGFTNIDNWTSFLVDISIWLTGSGAAGLLVAKGLKTISNYKNALTDAVAYGKDAQNVDPKDVEKVKEKHAKRQKQRGTKNLIDTSLQKVKDGTHA